MADREILLLGHVILEMETELLTGMRIGAGQAALAIGGLDNPVVRHPLTWEPYLPGSSFKGKMRSLLEKFYGKPQTWPIQDIYIHCCFPPPAVRRGLKEEELKEKKEQEWRPNYERCEVCRLFGVPAEAGVNLPTRLIVRDAFLSAESREKLERNTRTDLPFSEVKWEAAIDRVTAAAVPRQMERVPARAEFCGPSLTLGFYRSEGYRDSPELFDYLVTGLCLLEEDYLGGCGSRGYGKVKLKNLKLRLRGHEYYERGTGEVRQEFTDLPSLFSAKEEVKRLIEERILGAG